MRRLLAFGRRCGKRGARLGRRCVPLPPVYGRTGIGAAAPTRLPGGEATATACRQRPVVALRGRGVVASLASFTEERDHGADRVSLRPVSARPLVVKRSTPPAPQEAPNGQDRRRLAGRLAGCRSARRGVGVGAERRRRGPRRGAPPRRRARRIRRCPARGRRMGRPHPAAPALLPDDRRGPLAALLPRDRRRRRGARRGAPPRRRAHRVRRRPARGRRMERPRPAAPALLPDDQRGPLAALLPRDPAARDSRRIHAHAHSRSRSRRGSRSVPERRRGPVPGRQSRTGRRLRGAVGLERHAARRGPARLERGCAHEGVVRSRNHRLPAAARPRAGSRSAPRTRWQRVDRKHPAGTRPARAVEEAVPLEQRFDREHSAGTRAARQPGATVPR